jgi:DNA-binding transcriptional LysR family regulator
MPKSGCEPLIRELYRRQGLEPRVRYEASDVGTVIDMVQEGLGVTLVPELALPSLPRLQLVPLEPRSIRQLGLAVTAFSRCPPAVSTFAREACGSVPRRLRAKATGSRRPRAR